MANTSVNEQVEVRRRPTVCFGIVTGGKRLHLARAVLTDLTNQTEQPSEVFVVLQEGMGSGQEPAHAEALTKEFAGLDLSVRTNPGQGATAARNIILRECTADVIVFMDDDARVLGRAVEYIASSFEEHPEAAVITYRTSWVGGADGRRRYPSKPRRRRTVWSVSSVVFIELAASARKVRRLGAAFDELFDPGARYGTGGEFLFLADILRGRGVVLYEPLTIAKHDARTSGQRLDGRMMKAKGAVYRRAFGPSLGLVVGVLVSLQKTLSGDLECGPLEAIRGIVAGWKEFGQLPDDL